MCGFRVRLGAPGAVRGEPGPSRPKGAFPEGERRRHWDAISRPGLSYLPLHGLAARSEGFLLGPKSVFSRYTPEGLGRTSPCQCRLRFFEAKSGRLLQASVQRGPTSPRPDGSHSRRMPSTTRLQPNSRRRRRAPESKKGLPPREGTMLARIDTGSEHGFLYSILEGSPSIIFLKDPKGRYLYANPEFCRSAAAPRGDHRQDGRGALPRGAGGPLSH
jgi:PAS domain-containing protein